MVVFICKEEYGVPLSNGWAATHEFGHKFCISNEGDDDDDDNGVIDVAPAA
ncbi:hypothetical protein GLYMA_02G282300v4 [Glycine max]|uniref:Uncharacterized protein n=1 Tax=Glycine max TaxID=3847 RepID=K7KB97_SOYBN|nr:hypothetical protein GYH30_005482 [Glycine max]KRH73587.1 hypothetical protein GLYMA_02G282300v4 [Glycine max]